jgi:hypothetical protein
MYSARLKEVGVDEVRGVIFGVNQALTKAQSTINSTVHS